MNYTVFSDHTIGESHKKEGMGCEDYSGHYCDPEGRFAIAVICDGHSDVKCFRSAVGARLGCESLIQVMRKWMESFLEENYVDPAVELCAREKEILQRIRMAFVQNWNYKVREHLKSNPITKEELAKLDTPANRKTMQFYTEGKYLQHIYGATMLAVVGCDDFHMAMQIGDGIIIKLEKGGFYSVPVEDDDKDAAAEGPESMCDSDLLSREKAFRISVYPGCPQALFVTSDGVGDIAYQHVLWETLCVFQRELIKKQDEGDTQQGLKELNEAQKAFLHDFIAYYAVNGVNADDCCLSGFYDPRITVSDVRLSVEELQKLYASMAAEYQNREEKYKKSKALLADNLNKVQLQIHNLEKEIENLRTKEAELEAKLNIARNERDHYQEMQENNQQKFENATSQYEKNMNTLKNHYGTGETDWAVREKNAVDVPKAVTSVGNEVTQNVAEEPDVTIVVDTPKRSDVKDSESQSGTSEASTESQAATNAQASVAKTVKPEEELVNESDKGKTEKTVNIQWMD